jgi:hypothetical protein
METKFRFNIERLAFMITVVIILAIVLNLTIEDKDLVWQIVFGACLFIPAAYFTVNYLSGTSNSGGIFYENIDSLSKDARGAFSWSKYFIEFIVFVYVIVFLIFGGLILLFLRWFRELGVADDKVVESPETLNKTDINPIFERSENILAEMFNSEKYLAHDTALLNNFIAIVVITSLVALFCALLIFLLRKKNFKRARVVRITVYLLSTLSVLVGLFFLIFHNSFFISTNLKKLIENKNTYPEVVYPGESIVVTLTNSSGVTSINRNYRDADIIINKSEARLNNGSITNFKSLNVQPQMKWHEMKKNDFQSVVIPTFEMTIPEDQSLYGAIIDMDVLLSMEIPYFYEGRKYQYDLKRVSLNENLLFRIANISEIDFYKSSKRLATRIWYTNLGLFILLILTIILGVNSNIKEKISGNATSEIQGGFNKNEIEESIQLKEGEVICPNCNSKAVHGDHCKCGYYIVRPDKKNN